MFDGKVNDGFRLVSGVNGARGVVGGVDDDGLGVGCHVLLKRLEIGVVVFTTNRNVNGRGPVRRIIPS